MGNINREYLVNSAHKLENTDIKLLPASALSDKCQVVYPTD